ncbi:hypothetical protein L0152_12205 [bacterium]|nr:hypothetical protein [bacterium]
MHSAEQLEITLFSNMRKVLIVLIALSVLEACKLWQIPNWTRKEYLQKGKVWHKTDIPRMDIMAGPHSEISVRPEQEVTCRFVEPKTRSKGFSPKFKCKLKDGPTVRVKSLLVPKEPMKLYWIRDGKEKLQLMIGFEYSKRKGKRLTIRDVMRPSRSRNFFDHEGHEEARSYYMIRSKTSWNFVSFVVKNSSAD